MSSEHGNVNPNLPGSYQPVMNQDNFNAPSHNLSTRQQEQVAELAEASSGHIHPGGQSGSGVAGGSFGSGSLGNSGNTNLADTLSSTGGQSGQRGHLGQYEYTENQLDEPRDRVGRESEFGNTGRSGGLSGTGDGTRQAAGMGAGSGLAATAASQGLGSHGQSRSIEDQRLGGLIGDDNSHSSSRSGAGLGAAAVGTGGAAAYGSSSGRTGHGDNMQEAMRDASGHQGGSSRSGAGAAGLGGAAAGAAGLTAGQRDASGHGAGAGDKGMMSQPQYETGLTSELERRAQKSGTHAAGFGTRGNE